MKEMLIGDVNIELGLDKLVLAMPYPKKLKDDVHPVTSKQIAQFEYEKSEFVSAMHYIKNMVIDNLKFQVVKIQSKDLKRYNVFFDEGGLMCVFTLGFCFGTGVINLEMNPSKLSSEQFSELLDWIDLFFNLGYEELYTKAVVSHAEFYVDVAGEDLSKLVLIDNSRRTTTRYKGSTYLGKRGALNITTMYDKAHERMQDGKLVRVEARVNRNDIRFQDLVENNLCNPFCNVLVLDVIQLQLIADELNKPQLANHIREFGLGASKLNKYARKQIFLRLQKNVMPWWQPVLFWAAHKEMLMVMFRLSQQHLFCSSGEAS